MDTNNNREKRTDTHINTQVQKINETNIGHTRAGARADTPLYMHIHTHTLEQIYNTIRLHQTCYSPVLRLGVSWKHSIVQFLHFRSNTPVFTVFSSMQSLHTQKPPHIKTHTHTHTHTHTPTPTHTHTRLEEPARCKPLQTKASCKEHFEFT